MALVLLLPCLTAMAEDEKPAPALLKLALPEGRQLAPEQRKAAEACMRKRLQLALDNDALSLNNPWRLAKILDEYKSEALTTALADPDQLWAYVTAPDTPWKDRHAAAMKGGRVFPVGRLPNLLAARRALRREQEIHGWGMTQHPLSCAPMWWPRNRASMKALKFDPVRDVLGHKWKVSRNLYEYPLTDAELVDAPWPWHVEHALNSLLGSAAPSHRGNSDETWDAFGKRCHRWYEQCMKLPINDAEEMASFIEASKLPVHFMPMDVLAHWYKLALDPSADQWYTIAMAMQSRVISPRNSPNNAAAARVFFEDILKHNPKAAHNAQISLWIRLLQKHKNPQARAGYYNDSEVIRIRTMLREGGFGQQARFR